MKDSVHKILVVDDEKELLEMVRIILEREGFTVFTASSGDEGLNILKENQDIFLILSDQKMPGISGVDFLQKVRTLLPKSLRILYTGYSNLDTAIDAINKGEAYRYITKPWKNEEFIQIINEAAQRYGLMQVNIKLSNMVKNQNLELKQANNHLTAMLQKHSEELQKQSEDYKKSIDKIREDFLAPLFIIADLVDQRNPKYTNHSKNVANFCLKICREMNLPDELTENVRLAALLHDIGKITMSDEVLQKNLDFMYPKEVQEYMEHPLKGHHIIFSIEEFEEVAHLIKHHHEFFNGSGFPSGLTGEYIPFGARIIHVADFVEKTIRKFKPSDAIQLTIGELKNVASKRFDPNICKAAEKKLREMNNDSEIYEMG